MMRKACLIAGFAVGAAPAYAESGLTLYGRIDTGIEYMNAVTNPHGGQSSRFRAESGDWGTSLWGLTGKEDIGANTDIVFKLENSFNAMNGQFSAPNSIWTRWAAIGLDNPRYGRLQVGRQLFISYGTWDFDPFIMSSWSSASLVRGRSWPISSNNISYQSPAFHGFDFAAQYALSNATNWNGNGTTAQGRQGGFQITYTAPLFQIRGTYDEVRNPANGALDDVFQYSKEYFVGANVFLAPFKLQAVWLSSHAGQVAPGAPSVTNQIWGGVSWQVDAQASLIAAIYHVNANHGNGNATMYTLGGTYNLSKRTLLDFQMATVRNSKTGTFGLEANLPGSSTSPLPGQAQTGVYAGIQHTF